MYTERVDLYKYFNIDRPEGAEGYLNVYVQEEMERKPNRKRPAMLVIGGGGYFYVSGREKECVALKFVGEGFTAFVLDYSVAPVRYPAQLIEGLMAIVYIRENAQKLRTDPNHVAAVGFSAGGHLCSMLATLFDSDDARKALGERAKLSRPDAVILSYSVITYGDKDHCESFILLCGDDEELKKRLSTEKCVTKDSSPAFIWTTVDDNVVPSENSLYYALACKQNNVPFELHLFAHGEHGLSIATEEPFTVNKAVQVWVSLALTWLRERGFVIVDVD